MNEGIAGIGWSTPIGMRRDVHACSVKDHALSLLNGCPPATQCKWGYSISQLAIESVVFDRIRSVFAWLCALFWFYQRPSSAFVSRLYNFLDERRIISKGTRCRDTAALHRRGKLGGIYRAKCSTQLLSFPHVLDDPLRQKSVCCWSDQRPTNLK